MVSIVENLVTSTSLTPGDMTNIAPAMGKGVFVHNGKKWVRNDTVVIDDSDLDASLIAKNRYQLYGGLKTFNRSLGTVVATTQGNANGTVFIFCHGSNIAFVSINNGSDFALKRLPSDTFFAPYRDSAAISPLTGTVIACVSASGNSGRLRRSTDNWETTSLVGSSYSLNVFPTSVFCASNGHWYAGSNNGVILKSINDGVSWSSTGNTATNKTITSFTEGADGRIIVATSGSNLVYSDNGGSSWLQATGVSSLNTAVSYLGTLGNDKILLLVSSAVNQHRISKDNGKTWQPWHLIDDINIINGAYALWSNGHGKMIVGVAQRNYDGTKDRISWQLSDDFGGSITEIGTTSSEGAIGLAEGANKRLFMAASSFAADDSYEPYAYFNIGFSSGGDPSRLEQATLIKPEV